MTVQEPSPRFLGFSRRTIGICAVLYLLLVCYGTLYPFHDWLVPQDGFLRHFLIADSASLSKTDLITNFLVYIPLGLLWGGYFARHKSGITTVVLAGLIGTTLSFGLEAAQVFLPARTSTLSDLVLNSLGTIFGAVVALMLAAQTLVGTRLRDLRRDYFLPGAQVNIGLFVLCLWGLSQLSPLVPSLGVSTLRHGLKPVWHTLTGQIAFIPAQALVYSCSIAALGGIFLSLSRSRKKGLLLFALMVGAVLLLKVPVLSRQLSLEALLGCGGGFLLLVFLGRASDRFIVTCAGALLVTAFVIDSLRESAQSAQLIAFNWIPFRGHMQSITGLTNVLASGWVFLAAGYVVRYLLRSVSFLVVAVGGVLAGGLATLMELMQRSIPGRSPDITDVLIALVAWGCAWLGGASTPQARK